MSKHVVLAVGRSSSGEEGWEGVQLRGRRERQSGLGTDHWLGVPTRQLWRPPSCPPAAECLPHFQGILRSGAEARILIPHQISRDFGYR